MLIGIDSFVSVVTDPVTGVAVSPVERLAHLLEEVERADAVGLDTYGVGEHHRTEFFDSAPAVILAAAAARTKRIRLNSAVAYLSPNFGGFSAVVAGSASNYSSEQLAAETATYEALNRNTGNDMMNLGDILDEAAKKE